MKGRAGKLLGGMTFLVACLAPSGCGKVNLVDKDSEAQLRVLAIYPSETHNTVPSDLMVVASFNYMVEQSAGPKNINKGTFHIHLDGQEQNPIDVEPAYSDLDLEKKMTVVLFPPTLESGQTYHLVLAATVQGTDSQGKPTKALEQAVDTAFTVQ